MESTTGENSNAKWRRRGIPLIIALTFWLFWTVATGFLFRWWGELGLLLSTLLLGSLTFVGLAYLLLLVRREVWRQRQQDLSQLQRESGQLQDLIWLTARISPRRPLPYPLFRTGYEARLELLCAAWELIIEERPLRVLELGSGISSLVMAYALEASGRGELLAVEDSATYAGNTRRLLSEHSLSEHAHVIDSPLGRVQSNGETHHWYTLTDLCREAPIDFLFVDGPAGILSPMVGYPALPMLREFLADNALVLVDDTDREQEKLIGQRWMDDFPELQVCDHERYRNLGFTVFRICRAPADSS